VGNTETSDDKYELHLLKVAVSALLRMLIPSFVLLAGPAVCIWALFIPQRNRALEKKQGPITSINTNLLTWLLSIIPDKANTVSGSMLLGAFAGANFWLLFAFLVVFSLLDDFSKVWIAWIMGLVCGTILSVVGIILGAVGGIPGRAVGMLIGEKAGAIVGAITGGIAVCGGTILLLWIIG
jgi:hypothetical protein